MDNQTTTLIIAIFITIVCSGFFSATETAYSSLNKIKIKNKANDGDYKAEKVLALLENYDKLITTILIGNNIVNILGTSLATVLFVKYFPSNGVSISTAVMTILVLIFGEISPIRAPVPS